MTVVLWIAQILLGLVLPAATGLVTVLTPLAATGLAVIMVGAAITHARRKEPQLIVVNVILLAIAALIARGRFGPYGLQLWPVPDAPAGPHPATATLPRGDHRP